MLRQFGLQLVIERIARFLIPEQSYSRQSARIGNRRLQIEPPVRIHRQLAPAGNILNTASIRATVLLDGAPPIFIFTTV